MDLYLLAELNYIHLKISTVDLNKLTPSFRAKFDCTKPPSKLGSLWGTLACKKSTKLRNLHPTLIVCVFVLHSTSGQVWQ